MDCVSQALAWIYFKGDYQKLFAYGLRGAQEIASVTCWADTADAEHPKRQDRAAKDITAAAGVLKISEDAFRTTLDQIAADPYTKFLENIWS